ncbi:MAG: aldo/keto reductase [Flaviflexus sp.]|uniref:aldo/keto reductase n=1 Tax=Flaviflexus sp. TaxID=1969482 RepID=UPI00352C01AF
MSEVQPVTLSNGVEIPQIGLGVWEVPNDQVQQNVETALELGYRHIDTAAAYNNEEGVGAALKATGINRDDIFVTTKLRNGEQGYESVFKAFDDSLQRLGLDYVDLYLIHWPSPKRGLYVKSWMAIQEIYEDKRTRAIGVANFLPEYLQILLDGSDIAPMVNQIELHPSYQQAEVEKVTRLEELAVEAYSPLGRGADLKEQVVLDIAQRVGATPAQVVLAWHLAKGRIVIPKSVSSVRMEENLHSASVHLSADDLTLIDSLEAGNMQVFDPREVEKSQIY